MRRQGELIVSVMFIAAALAITAGFQVETIKRWGDQVGKGAQFSSAVK